MNDGIMCLRGKQEELFALRDECAKMLRDASMELELAALGGVDAQERVLRAAHRIGSMGNKLLRLAGQVNVQVMRLSRPSVN